jgi:hypothetical protein
MTTVRNIIIRASTIFAFAVLLLIIIDKNEFYITSRNNSSTLHTEYTLHQALPLWLDTKIVTSTNLDEVIKVQMTQRDNVNTQVYTLLKKMEELLDN